MKRQGGDSQEILRSLFSEGTDPTDTWLGLLASRTVSQWVSVVKPFCLWYFVMAALAD